MGICRIYSKNAAYQKFQVLKTNRQKRRRYGEFFVEGVRNLNEAVKNGWQVTSFLYAMDAPLSGWARDMLAQVKTEMNYELAPALMAELSGKGDTSELLAIARQRPDSFSQLGMPENPLWVLFDRPSNRGNLGSVIRSCDGLGASGLILTGHGVDLYDPEVVGASMGSFFRVPAVRAADNQSVLQFIADMRARYPGLRTVGTTAHRQAPVYGEGLSGPLLFLIGNETDGLCYAFKNTCDVLCTIPMAEGCAASSFNVACAATVLLYEATRQRSAGKPVCWQQGGECK